MCEAYRVIANSGSCAKNELSELSTSYLTAVRNMKFNSMIQYMKDLVKTVLINSVLGTSMSLVCLHVIFRGLISTFQRKRIYKKCLF